MADGYGRLASAVVLEGRNPRARPMDLLIAATAYAHGARLYTCNPSDFLGLADFIDVGGLTSRLACRAPSPREMSVADHRFGSPAAIRIDGELTKA